MLDPLGAFEARKHEIEPVIVNFFERDEFGGEDAIRAYGSVILFHATHSSNADRIDQEGLSADFEIVDPEDVQFAKDLLDEVQTRRGYVDFNDLRLFENLIEGKQINFDGKGYYFHAHYPDETIQYNDGYGIPERLAVLTKEMAFVASSPNFTQEQRQQAGEIVEKYSSRIFAEGAEIVVFEADPFHGPIINTRLKYVPENIRDSGYSREDVLEALGSLNYTDYGGIFIPESISANALQRHGTMPLDQEKFRQQLDPKRTSMFYEL